MNSVQVGPSPGHAWHTVGTEARRRLQTGALWALWQLWTRIARLALFAAAALLLTPAQAQTAAAAGAQPSAWPGKQPIRLLVPASPGGSLDALTRPLAARLGEVLGQTVVVENRGGAGGVLGADLVAKAPADGYTFLMGAIHHAIAPGVYPKMPYDSARDLQGVAHIGTVPNMVIVNDQVPAKTLAEFVAWAKRNPGKANYATGGAGTLHHLSTEMFKNQAGIFVVPIHYRGSGPAVIDLIANNVQLMFETLPSAAVQVRAGKLKALAVTSLQRSPAFPQVPTIAESGYPGFEATTWYGVMAPAKTPPEVVKLMNEAVNKALRRDDIVAAWRSLGVEATPMPADRFQAFWLGEIKRWGDTARANRVSLE
jgi:tripartite-type tricarboxylate transporter receptor subunit TctC